MSEPTSIHVHGCARTYPDGTRALHATDLDIARGETLVFLGPSGCGKTTLLRVLSGLDRPDPGGRILFGEEDVTATPIERRRVGMVFQSYALFPNMTVAGNVGYGPRLQRLSRAEREARVARSLDLCRIASLADRQVDQLSGGQRQRVALARALAAEPRAIFLDEPLTALDAALRGTLREEIAALLKGLGVTAIYVTHDQTEAMALADRIAVMNAGRIEQVGTPQQIYDDPATRFVAGFVGESSVRTLPDGRLRLDRPEAVRLLPEGEGVPATVVALTWLGPVTRLTVETHWGPVRVDDHARRPLSVGDRVGLAFDDARALTFPPETP